jgi:hypothetical protein
MMEAFHNGLTKDEQADPEFAYRVAFIPKLGNRASNSDLAIEFFKADSDEARDVNKILLKEVDKARYTAGQIVNQMQKEGFPNFNQHNHTKLWKDLDAKNPGLGFGRVGDYKNTWVWYSTWLARVRAHCQEHAERYS